VVRALLRGLGHPRGVRGRADRRTAGSSRRRGAGPGRRADGERPSTNPRSLEHQRHLSREVRMKVRTINPFHDANEFWLGLEEDGLRRKVVNVVYRGLVASQQRVAGLTIFDPVAASSYHNHPESEVINYIVGGAGK